MGNGDEEGLEAVVGTSPKYLGLVASKEKAKSLFQYLRDKGTPAEHLDSIKCPAGLELGAETLPEIALSVIAEITRLRRTVSEHVSGHVSEQAAVKSEQPVSLPIILGEVSLTEGIDPVCGMSVATENARYKTVLKDNIFYFCCLRCKEAFERSPQLYI
jgi:xanthine dehydrogenase accessory factor